MQWYKNILVAVELPEKQGLKLKYCWGVSQPFAQLQWNFQKNKD